MGNFNERLPKWENPGTEPPASKQIEGWQPQEKPPAGWLNWLFNRSYKAIEELQEKVITRDEGDFAARQELEEHKEDGSAHGIDDKLQVVMSTVSDEHNAHLIDNMNPHEVTKVQIGLGNVENYGIANQIEAEAGVVTNKYMTPLRTKQAIDALVQAVKISGSGTFNTTTGRTILHSIGHTNYKVIITVTSNPNGYLGEYWVIKNNDSFVVYCSGSTSEATFDYVIL